MTPKPRTPKPEALPAPYPDVEPGDHVYVRHPERGPMAVRVLATGKHGLTATCPMGDLYRVHWERILGVKSRMSRKFKLVDNGAEGCILEDDQGQRRYVAHAEDEGDDDKPDDKPLHKSQPTPAQIEAGNYKKRHIRFQGLEISIENPSGSVRKGVDRDGHEWRTRMVHAYGYIRGSKGVDKDHVDCYIGPNLDASHAYIVHQRKAGQWDRYDEDKVMLGFDTEVQAKTAYLKHYDDPRFLGPVTALPMDEFKRKVMATADKPKMIKAFPAHARALFLKARVKAHTRRLASGKITTVHAYTDKRRNRDEKTGDLFAEAMENPDERAPGNKPEPEKAPARDTDNPPAFELTADEFMARRFGNDAIQRRLQQAKDDRDREWVKEFVAKEAITDHRNIVRARIIDGHGVPEAVLKSHGLDNPNEMAALLAPRHLGELPIKAVIARGKSIADDLVPNFSSTLAAITLQDVENQKKQSELASQRSGINRLITTHTRNLNDLKSAYLDPDTGEYKPERITEKEQIQKAIIDLERQIETLHKDKIRVIGEQKKLVKESSTKTPLTLAEKLIKAMQKHVKTHMEQKGTTVKQEIKHKNIGIGSVPASSLPLADMSADLKRGIAAALTEFVSLFGIDSCSVNAIVRLKDQSRACYNPISSNGPIISIGRDRDRETVKTMLFHELGHSMKSHENYQACKKFVISRRKSDQAQPLGDGHDKWETAFPGDFINDYVGKDWSIQGDTEVLSMGVERFSSADALARFAMTDPEHVYLVLACVPELRAYTDLRDEGKGIIATVTKE